MEFGEWYKGSTYMVGQGRKQFWAEREIKLWYRPESLGQPRGKPWSKQCLWGVLCGAQKGRPQASVAMQLRLPLKELETFGCLLIPQLGSTSYPGGGPGQHTSMSTTAGACQSLPAIMRPRNQFLWCCFQVPGVVYVIPSKVNLDLLSLLSSS